MRLAAGRCHSGIDHGLWEEQPVWATLAAGLPDIWWWRIDEHTLQQLPADLRYQSVPGWLAFRCNPLYDGMHTADQVSRQATASRSGRLLLRGDMERERRLAESGATEHMRRTVLIIAWHGTLRSPSASTQ